MTIQTDGINKDSYGNKEIQEGRLVYAADTASTDTYVVSLQPAATEYVTGMVINFLATTANTGASTLNVNGLGAKNILKNHDQTLADGDIEAAQVVTVVYDGTQFQMQSQTGTALETGDLGANVATFLATPTSANLAAAVTNETGSGALVFGTSPTIATPVVTWPAGGPVLPNLLTNSLGKAWSGSTLENVGTVIFEDQCATDGTANYTVGANAALADGTGHYHYTTSNTTLNTIQVTAAQTTVVGKLYRFSVTISDGDVSGKTVQLHAGTALNGTQLGSSLVFTTDGTPTARTLVFEATTTTSYLSVGSNGQNYGGYVTVDAFTLFEVTPGYVAADTLAPDTMTKTATLDIHRESNAASANTYGYGTFLFKLTKGADTAEYLNFGTAIDYRDCQGKAVTLGCYVYSLTANDNIKLSIHDGLTEVGLSSAYVTNNAVTWVELTATLAAGATALTPRILCDGDTADVAYISEPILVRGSSIGTGNYQPIPNEVIMFQSAKTLTPYSNVAVAASTTINIEAASDGVIGKGVKGIYFTALATNSTPGAALVLTNTSSVTAPSLDIICHVNGIGNRGSGFVGCDSNGDVYLTVTDAGHTAVYLRPRGIMT